MDATIYNLESLRSARNSRMLMEKCFQMPLTSDGLELLTSATAFWVQYIANMASYHHRVLSAGFSPFLRNASGSEKPSGWR